MNEFYCNVCDCLEFNVDKDEDIILTCTECGEQYRIVNKIEVWK